MQSGTQLHLALLRKISHLLPSSNYRQRFNQSRKQRDFIRPNLTQQLDHEQQLRQFRPLFQLNSNHTPQSKSRKSRPLLREENITISGWSIDEADKLQQQQTRYNKRLKELSKNELPSPRKHRNLSFNTNIRLRKQLPQLELTRTPSNDKRRQKQKQMLPRSKFSKIKQININIDKQNGLTILQHFLLKENKLKSIEKISSYHQFVSEMKTQEKNKKLRN